MEKQERYFLKKDDRLKSRKAINALFAKGNSFSNFPFRVFRMQEQGTFELKAGFSASSRNFKKAVDRNRIKRLMREAYRLQKNNLQDALKSNPAKLHLFFIYTGKEVPDYEPVFEKMGSIMKRLIKMSNENTETNS